MNKENYISTTSEILSNTYKIYEAQSIQSALAYLDSLNASSIVDDYCEPCDNEYPHIIENGEKMCFICGQ